MRGLVFVSLLAIAFAGNPDENRNITDPTLIEGDIKIAPGQGRGSTKWGLWPGGVVPYEFSSKFAASSSAVAAARAAMNEWSRVTCITFRERTVEQSYISFVIEWGCFSNVGMIGYKQKLSLGSGCQYEGIAVHELGHALGFHHEQSRPDRDEYVTILYENIKKDKNMDYKHNFNKHSEYYIDSLGTEYDYNSIMHYGSNYFSKNGSPTIISKKPGVTLGQRYGLTATDIRQMRLLYKCKDPPFVGFTTGCDWRTAKAANRCWRYCNPHMPSRGRWCWTNRSCGVGFLSLEEGGCPGSVMMTGCDSACED